MRQNKIFSQSFGSPGGEWDIAQAGELARMAVRLEPWVKHELRRFARMRWPGARPLGMLNGQPYRLRRQSGARSMVWWVEHDIPPYDRYHCQAYRVQLSRDHSGLLHLEVFSGVAEIPVEPISAAGLRSALSLAGSQAPLIIQRQFDPVLDP